MSRQENLWCSDGYVAVKIGFQILDNQETLERHLRAACPSQLGSAKQATDGLLA